MKSFIDILKGIAIGISNVVAGLSGGTVAILCKVYDGLIDIFTNIWRHPIKVIKNQWKLIVGLVIGIVGGAVVLSKLYEFAPLPVSMLFCGIVIASFIPLCKATIKKNNKFYHYLIMAIAAAVVIIIPILSKGSSKELGLDIGSILIIFGLGVISAASMIIPGVSGSMILSAFGYYETTFGMIPDFLERLFKWDLAGLGNTTLKLIIFGVGCVIGIVFCALLIKVLFKRCKTGMDHLVLGLVGSSSIAMIMVILINNDNAYLFNSKRGMIMWIVGALLFIIGLGFGIFLNKLGKSSEVKNMENKFDNDFFMKKAKEYTPKWIEMTKKLVSFESVLEEFKPNSDAPFGEENKKALNWMLDYAKENGFEVKNCDNYAGDITFGEGNETLGILAHLDVVPAVGKWTNYPFDATLTQEGKLVGRGVNDDKGPLAAAYFALEILRDMGVKPSRKIKLIMGCDEETGSRCLAHYFEKNPMPEIGFSPDACFPCINGEKAGVSFDIVGKLKNSAIVSMYAGERYNIVPSECKMTLNVDLKNEYLQYLKDNNYNGEIIGDEYVAYGVSAHAMCPEKGLNASFILFDFINQYKPCELSKFMVEYINFDPFGEKTGIDVSHFELGVLTMNVGIVRISDENVRIGFDCRVPVENHDKVMKEKFDDLLKDTLLETKFNRSGKIHYVPKDSYLVSTLMDSYKSITNDNENGPYSIGGGTYAKFIDNAVAFGPQFVGSEDVDHQADEYVYVDDYTKVIAIYAKAIYELVK